LQCFHEYTTFGNPSKINLFTPAQEELAKSLKKKFKKYRNGLTIPNAVIAVSNADGTINKYALKTLYAISKGLTTNWIENIKIIFSKENGCDSYRLGGLNAIAKIVNACKDKNGNPNKTNLKFAQELETHRGYYSFEQLPDVINLCKNEEGVVIGEKYELFNKLSAEGLSGCMMHITDKEGKIDQTALDFVMNNAKLATTQDIQTFMIRILNFSKGEDREEILKTLTTDFKKFLDKNNKLRCDIFYLQDKNKNINLNNIKKLFLLLNIVKFEDMTFINRFILKNQDGIITQENIDNLLRLDTRMSYREMCEELTPLDGFLNEIGGINKKFVDFYNKMIKMDILNEYDFKADYNYAMEIATQEDGTIDWDVMNVFYQLSCKLDENSHSDNSNKLIPTLWNKAQDMGRNEDGKYTKEGLQKIIDYFKLEDKYEEDISLNALNNGLKNKQSKNILEEIVKDKNLYEASQMLEVFKELKSKRKLNQKTLNAPLKEWDNLMMVIPDILPTEANKSEYNELLRMLGTIKDLNFNVKDSIGISFLEKVIISENHRLLDVMKASSVDLNYYPEIELAFPYIQNPLFKDIVENLDLKFADLEEAAKLGSIEMFQKLESQLDSIFMKDKKGELIKLQKLINQSKNKELKAYFKDKYKKEIN